MNSENTDIMYLDFSNALHQVSYKISFAWSIQIGLDMSTATHLNKRPIKASWQSSNNMWCFEYLQIWNSSYTQENLSNICHKISTGSTWISLTFTKEVWCPCTLQRSQLQWSVLTAHCSSRIPASPVTKGHRDSTCTWGWVLTGDFAGMRGREGREEDCIVTQKFSFSYSRSLFYITLEKGDKSMTLDWFLKLHERGDLNYRWSTRMKLAKQPIHVPRYMMKCQDRHLPQWALISQVTWDNVHPPSHTPLQQLSLFIFPETLLFLDTVTGWALHWKL